MSKDIKVSRCLSCQPLFPFWSPCLCNHSFSSSISIVPSLMTVLINALLSLSLPLSLHSPLFAQALRLATSSFAPAALHQSIPTHLAPPPPLPSPPHWPPSPCLSILLLVVLRCAPRAPARFRSRCGMQWTHDKAPQLTGGGSHACNDAISCLNRTPQTYHARYRHLRMCCCRRLFACRHTSRSPCRQQYVAAAIDITSVS